jgi:hypothetical protein
MDNHPDNGKDLMSNHVREYLIARKNVHSTFEYDGTGRLHERKCSKHRTKGLNQSNPDTDIFWTIVGNLSRMALMEEFRVAKGRSECYVVD